MALRATTTLALCLAGGLGAGIALARPATTTTPQPVVEASPGIEQPVDVTATMTIEGFAFSAVTVGAGAPVSVANADSAPHTATSSDGLFDTDTIAGSSNGAFTAPSTPGTYALFCAIHPSMQGQLIVT